MAKNAGGKGQYQRQLGKVSLLHLVLLLGWLGAAILAVLGTQPAIAQESNKGEAVLQAVDISPLAGNRLQLRFRFSEPLTAPPSTFTINEPARIVLDFLGTRNGLETRQKTINIGVADKISVLEGADRTRASLNLAKLVPYKVEMQGDSVLLTLEGAGTAAKRTPALLRRRRWLLLRPSR